jgi:hypothetical protein
MLLTRIPVGNVLDLVINNEREVIHYANPLVKILDPRTNEPIVVPDSDTVKEYITKVYTKCHGKNVRKVSGNAAKVAKKNLLNELENTDTVTEVVNSEYELNEEEEYESVRSQLELERMKQHMDDQRKT